MPTKDLTDLATIGGQSLVEIMAMPEWPPVRDNALSLFRDSDPQQHATVGYLLDQDAATLCAAPPHERDDVGRELAASWRRHLIRLLTERPAAESDLRSLIAEIRAKLPADRPQRIQRQVNIARDNATVFAVQDGSLHYHQAGGPAAQPPDPDGADAGRAGPA
jgi:hypothetical protein